MAAANAPGADERAPERCCRCRYFFFMDMRAAMGRCLNVRMAWPFTERGRRYPAVGRDFSCRLWEPRGERCPGEVSER